MFTAAFWRAVGERAVSTFIQTAIAVLAVLVGPHVARGDGLEVIPWVQYLSVAALAGVLSVLKGVAAGSKDGNPSVGSVEVLATPGATAEPVTAEPVEVIEAEPRRAVPSGTPDAEGVVRDH